MSTIRLQFINDYFYPTDEISRRALEKEMRLGRFPKERLDWISPALVVRGYALAITGYDVEQKESVDYSSRGIKIGGTAKPMADPCVKCHLRDLCDADDCGRKSFRLFTNN